MTQKGFKLSRFINLILFFLLHCLLGFVRLLTSLATLLLRSFDDNDDDDEKEGWFCFHNNSKRRQL